MVIGIDPYVIAKDALTYIRGKIKEDPELLDQFVKLRECIVDLHEENLSLRKDLESLTKEHDIKNRLSWDPDLGVYWFEDNDKKIPCCPRCYNKESILSFMTSYKQGWACPTCRYGAGIVNKQQKHADHNPWKIL